MEEQNQLNLFTEEELKDSQPNFLHVIHDGEVKKRTMDQLFDSTAYTELKAVSFVASHNFFFKTVRDFQSVQLILGIEDGHVAGGFVKGIGELLDIEARVSYIQSLPEDIRQQILQYRFEIRFSKKGTPIHSKIYLLKGPGGTRVMIGSANFTVTALSNQRQYEELLLFDDSPYYDLFLTRFENIYEETVDYIPEKVKSSLLFEPINIADPELMKEILIDEVREGRLAVEFTEVNLEEIQSEQEKAGKDKEKIVEFQRLIEVITKKSRSTGQRRLLTAKELQKKTITIKNKFSHVSKKTAKIDSRFHLIYNPMEHRLYVPVTQERESEGDLLVPFSKRIVNREELKKQFQLIDQFLETYRLFTVQDNKQNQSKIFEAILYAFVSAHIWKMRDHHVNEEGRENVRRNIPPFLMIAGRTMSGKTTALEFIGMLLGNTHPYFSYEQVSSRNVLYDLFHSDNLNPIVIDEIDEKFFNSKATDKGEQLIKNINNNLSGQHPVLIGTTNATGFGMGAQAISRMYYLQIDNTFDKDKMAESSAYLGAVMSEVNASLFQDFTARLGEKIQYGEPFYSTSDFLSVARDLFKEYYAEFDLALPDWFPEHKFNDYYERGKLIWQELYRSNSTSFDFRKDNTVLVRTEELSINISGNANLIVNYLPPQCIQEDSSVLVLYKEPFKKFIEFDKYFKQSFLQKIFK